LSAGIRRLFFKVIEAVAGLYEVFLGYGMSYQNSSWMICIALVPTHDYPTNHRVISLGPMVPAVFWITAVFEGNKVVLLIAGWIVGTSQAPDSIDLPNCWIDELRPSKAGFMSAEKPTRVRVSFLLNDILSICH